VFDPVLAGRLADVVGRPDSDRPAPVIGTGAGHDAGIFAAAGVPTAMLFVRNPTGISHSPAEFAEEADCDAGVRALTAVLADLLTGAGNENGVMHRGSAETVHNPVLDEAEQGRP
jgi:beta-ureidopropionase / N-carbamoyl-L-amino-acid hydrolase